MSLEGALHLRIGWDGCEVTSVKVQSTRAPSVARLLAGKPAEEAAATVPRLYSLCARAQSAAAARAVDAALGREPDAEAASAQELNVMREIALEYLWRLSIDLPQALDEAPRAGLVAGLRRRLAPGGPDAAWQELADALTDTLEGEVLGMPLGEWLHMSAAGDVSRWLGLARTDFARWLSRVWEAGGEREAARLMPPATREAVMKILLPALDADDEFARKPDWNGDPKETGALARHADHPLIRAARSAGASTIALRLLARAVELARIAEEARSAAPASRVQSASDSPDAGVAWVENARGLLLHRVRLAADRVRDYAIVAPTEWNFHPRGAFVQALTGMRAGSEALVRRHARLLAQSLDPCVAFDMVIGHA